MDKLEAAKRMLREWSAEELRQIRRDLERAITLRYTGQGNPSLRRRSGQLARAPRWEQRIGNGSFMARLFIPQSGRRTIPIYAGVHERGATIVPRRAKVLAWQDTKPGTAAVRGGRWHFARRVRLPARPVWATVRRTELPKIRHRAEQRLARATKAVNRGRWDAIR